MSGWRRLGLVLSVAYWGAFLLGVLSMFRSGLEVDALVFWFLLFALPDAFVAALVWAFAGFRRERRG